MEIGLGRRFHLQLSAHIWGKDNNKRNMYYVIDNDIVLWGCVHEYCSFGMATYDYKLLSNHNTSDALTACNY
jgi:hypothetical protein